MEAALDNLRGGGVVFGPSGSFEEEDEEDSPAVSSDFHIHQQHSFNVIWELYESLRAVQLTRLHVCFPGFTECFGPAWAGGPLLL